MTWLTGDVQLLLLTALSIGVVHTLIGPDHYVPFVALARQRGWTLRRTLGVTTLCGAGHCASSVAIGTLGIALGTGLTKLESLESARGDIAAWLLLGFGLALLARSMQRRKRRHHDDMKLEPTLFASLFVIFVLGPCEALIPLLMFPAATANTPAILAVTLVFCTATLITMLVCVGGTLRALPPVFSEHLSTFGGHVTGAAIALCGAAMLVGL
ncbi:MAG: hypothetical protein AB8G16_16370 [Gammaproteobacteria bacterium]